MADAAGVLPSDGIDDWIEVDADMYEPTPSCVPYELTDDGVVIYPPEQHARATSDENKENSIKASGSNSALAPLGENQNQVQPAPPQAPPQAPPRAQFHAAAYSGNVRAATPENEITDAALERMVADHDRNHVPRRHTEFLHENQRWYLIRWLPTSGSGDPVSGPPNIQGAIDRPHLTGINPTNPRERHDPATGIRNRLLWAWEGPWGLSPHPSLQDDHESSRDGSCWFYGWNWTQRAFDRKRSSKHFVRRRMWVRTRRERGARATVSSLLGMGFPESAIGAACAEAQLVGVGELDLERLQGLLEESRR